MSNLTLQSAPAVAVIDQNNTLTVNWQPPVCNDGLYDQYSGWNITYQGSGPSVTQLFPAPVGYSGANLFFTQVLGSSPVPYTLTMTAKAVNSFSLTQVATSIGGAAVYTGSINGGNNSFVGISFIIAGFVNGSNNGTFVCTASTSTTLTLQNASATVESASATASMSPSTAYDSPAWETNDVETVRNFPTALALANVNFSSTSVLLGQALTVTLGAAYTGADQWNVLWPDNTSTGWLPLANNVVVKSFSNPGTFNVIIQTRRNYSGAQFSPATTLISQIVQQIFVINQQSATSSTTQQGLQGNLGIGGQQGFEITQANSGSATPNPWEVIARSLARDTVTQELKLLIATTRFSNASSLYGTMAVDVFPIEGRPRAKEFVLPPYELTATAATESTPVSVSTTALPTLYVGKSVVQALGGTFQMQTQGGVAPFIWTVDPLPKGVTMNTAGVINGTPLELGLFTATFAVEDSSVPPSIAHATLDMLVETDMQVQIASGQKDANGNTLNQTGTSLGIAQVGTIYKVQMQVGNINTNSTLAGGLPPYQWSAPAGAFPVGLSIDPNSGLISGTPQTYNSTTDFTTTYSVTIQVADSIGAKATQTYTMTLEPAALQFGHVNQTTVFAFQEFKLAVPVFGGKSPYILTGFGPAPTDTQYYGPAALVDGQVEVQIGGSGSAIPGGFTTTGNRTFSLTVTDSTTPIANIATAQFTFDVETQLSDVRLVPGYLTNATHPTDGSWGILDTSQATLQPSGSFSGYQLSGTRLDLVSNANTSGGNTVYTGVIPALDFSSSDTLIVAGFSNSANNGAFKFVSSTASSPLSAPNGTITLNNPNGVASTATTYSITSAANASAGSTVYSGTFANGLSGLFFTVSGFVLNPQNNGTFVCTASSLTTLTLSNAYGAAEAQAATATQTIGKTLGGSATTFVLANGIATAIDPTSASAVNLPDSEWFGPPGNNVVNTNAYYGNAQYRVPLVLNYDFQFSYVANGSGGNTVYTYESSQSTSGSGLVGLQFTVSGFLNAANNGTFTCVAADANTLTLNNPSGVASYATITATAATSNVVTFTAANSFTALQEVYVQGTAEPSINTQRFFQVASVSNPPSGPSTSFTANFAIGDYSNPAEPGTAIVITPNPFAKAVSVSAANTISREYTALSHSDPATFSLTQVATSVGTTAVYTGTIPNGANNAFAGYSFSVTGFATAANNGYYTCTASSTSTLTLANSNAVVETHAALAAGDIGNITSYARPYIVGDVVGFNPRKPWFNSPQLGPINGSTSPYSPIPLTARVEVPSTLPPGLSLDANTGLIYGTLAGVQTAPTTIQYLDVGGTVHGTVTINWALYQSAYQLIDNVLDAQQVGIAFSGSNAFTAPGSVTLQSASLVGGQLPHGLVVGASGNNITITGTPTEAGYFDCWFSCISTTGQNAYAYHRVSTLIPSAALTITGWSDPSVPGVVNSFIGNALPNATISAVQQYGPSATGVQLVATGGNPPYTWSSSPTPMNTTAPNLALSSSGLITGTTPSAFSPNPATFTFTVTDSHAAIASASNITITTQASGLHFTNSPFAIPIISGRAINYQLTATGGVLPFTYSLSPNNQNPLPTGISVSSSGLVTGSTLQSGYSKTVTFRVVDSLGAYSDQGYTVSVTAGLALKTGIDYTDNTSTGYLGYIDAGNVATINPAPNLSFYVVATGVNSTSTLNIGVALSNPNISVGTIQLDTGTQTALIPLTGAFNAGSPGNNNLVVSVTDSGVQVTQTFQWLVYNDGSMVVSPSSGSFPTQILNPVVVLPPPPPSYNFKIVQTATATQHYHCNCHNDNLISPTSGSSLILPSPVKAGNALILCYISYGYNSRPGPNQFTVTDNLSNIWQFACNDINPTYFNKYVAYVQSAAGGTVSLTLNENRSSLNSSFMAAILFEVDQSTVTGGHNGFISPIVVDGANAAEAAGGTSGAITTANANDLLISVMTDAPSGSLPSGWTLIGTAVDNTASGGGNGNPGGSWPARTTYTSAAYLQTTSAGVYNPVWTSLLPYPGGGSGCTVALKLSPITG